jgi:hypothetical protein
MACAIASTMFHVLYGQFKSRLQQSVLALGDKLNNPRLRNKAVTVESKSRTMSLSVALTNVFPSAQCLFHSPANKALTITLYKVHQRTPISASSFLRSEAKQKEKYWLLSTTPAISNPNFKHPTY